MFPDPGVLGAGSAFQLGLGHELIQVQIDQGSSSCVCLGCVHMRACARVCAVSGMFIYEDVCTCEVCVLCVRDRYVWVHVHVCGI